ncbi:Imm21 family immunity protein [Streptomyces sp. NPDC055287]
MPGPFRVPRQFFDCRRTSATARNPAGSPPQTCAELKAAARAVLADAATQWEECGTWVSDGPATLMDSAEALSRRRDARPGIGPATRQPLEGPCHPHQGGRGQLGRPGPDSAHRILKPPIPRCPTTVVSRRAAARVRVGAGAPRVSSLLTGSFGQLTVTAAAVSPGPQAESASRRPAHDLDDNGQAHCLGHWRWEASLRSAEGTVVSLWDRTLTTRRCLRPRPVHTWCWTRIW